MPDPECVGHVPNHHSSDHRNDGGAARGRIIVRGASHAPARPQRSSQHEKEEKQPRQPELEGYVEEKVVGVPK